MIKIKNVSELSLEEIAECIKIYNETGEYQMEGDILGRIAELWDEIPNYISNREITIKQIKKQIKYSKNPLEIKRLNKELNTLYKKKK